VIGSRPPRQRLVLDRVLDVFAGLLHARHGLVLLAFALGVLIASDFAYVLLGCTCGVLSGIFGLIDDSHWVYPFCGGQPRTADDRATTPRGVVADSLVSGSRPGARDRVIPCAARNAGHVGLGGAARGSLIELGSLVCRPIDVLDRSDGR